MSEIKPTLTPVKTGYKTTEFWLSSAAAFMGLLFASGIVGAGSGLEKALGFVAAALSAFGYSIARGMTKKQ